MGILFTHYFIDIYLHFMAFIYSEGCLDVPAYLLIILLVFTHYSIVSTHTLLVFTYYFICAYVSQ